MTSAPDGSLRIRGRNILDMRLEPGDTGVATVRAYLCELVKEGWFKDSLSHRHLAEPLVKMGVIPGKVDDQGTVTDWDEDMLTDRLFEAIETLSAEPFGPIRVKTDTQRQAARLQRRNSRGKKRR